MKHRSQTSFRLLAGLGGIALFGVGCGQSNGDAGSAGGSSATGSGGVTGRGGAGSGGADTSNTGGAAGRGAGAASGGAGAGRGGSGGTVGTGGAGAAPVAGGNTGHGGAAGTQGTGGATAGASGAGGGPGTGGATVGSGGTSARGGSTGATGTGGMVPDRDGGRTDASAADATAGTPDGSAPTACSPPAAGSKGSNPLFSDQFTADPAVMVDNCTFYIQCGHDQAAAGQNAFIMKEWFLLKSTDMVHWTKIVAMDLTTFKWANANAWAGQMIRAVNGKYFWYVPIQQASDGTMTIGVATADAPEGPWKDALGKALINDTFEMANEGFKTPSDTSFTIDPTVFIDDDGQAYLQYGGFGRLTTAKLNADMISIDGKMVESSPRGYFESPYLIKRNGKYYEIYAAGQNPATIDWATSASPMGPWTYGGRILDALPRASGETDWPTNHAGVGQLAGQWYIAYHVSNGPDGGGTYRREVAVDKLTWSGDSPQKVTPSAGLSF